MLSRVRSGSAASENPTFALNSIMGIGGGKISADFLKRYRAKRHCTAQHNINSI
jgi:hypothetical protein